ncbi:PilW family protein [Piscinibacter terrae]|nr:PilW family protein [Albitalea terrae]
MNSNNMSLVRPISRQRGLTLVELMVGLVIGIVISLAASALYLATRESSRAAQGHTDINETGKIALDMIGRELQKAGFYPAQFTTPSDVAHSGRYYNPTTYAAFTYGLSGCDDKAYDPATHACSSTTTTGDTVIISYFSSPEFGTSSLLGNTNDCNRQAVSGDSVNTPLAAASMPLFVSNRFGLSGLVTYTAPDGSTVSTRNLTCQGNGADSTAPQSMIQGVDDLVIRYGVSAGNGVQSPTAFRPATGASGVTSLSTTSDGLNPWQRVTAVSVCIEVRSMDNNRLEDKSGSERTYVNCRGSTITPTDKYLHKVFTRVFAVRNNLNAVGTF